jgi:hypothetical protein
MKKILLALTAASALAATAAPALAQSYDGYDRGDRYDRYDRGDRYERGWVSIDQRLSQLDRRIDRGVRSGQITRSEAYRLRGEFRMLVRLENRYRMDGLNRWERDDLNRRFDALSERIRWERHDGDRYSSGYGPRY